jgi:hypothetical protein
MSELSQLFDEYQRGPVTVEAAIAHLAKEELDFQEAPDRWSIRQIVAHLADSELLSAVRFRQMLVEDSPAFPIFDQNAWAERLDYAHRTPEDSLSTLRRIRSDNYDLLKSRPETDLHRTGVHPKRGVISILDLLKIFANHPQKHANQIRRVRDSFRNTSTQTP